LGLPDGTSIQYPDDWPTERCFSADIALIYIDVDRVIGLVFGFWISIFGLGFGGFGSLLEFLFTSYRKARSWRFGVPSYLERIPPPPPQGNGNVASYDPTGAMIMDE
jgi:hypothetical protein